MSVYFRSRAIRYFGNLARSCRKLLAQGMQKTAEETALNTSSEIDTRAFMWIFDCLDEDHELESFFSGLPGFRSSKVVNDPLPSLTDDEMLKVYEALHGLLERTFSSDLLPAPIKNRRALICAKAVDPVHSPVDWSFAGPKPTAFRILDLILSTYQYSGPVVTGIAKVLGGWGLNKDEDSVVYAQSTICEVLATSQPRDDSWYNIASDELGFPETSLQDYAAQGDSLSLVILIHVVRQQITYPKERSWLQKYELSLVLSKASKFNAKDTSSELQHEFCALWNQIVNKAQDGNDGDMAFFILSPIRNVFLALHQDTDSSPSQFSASTNDRDDILKQPTSYPVCKVPDHNQDDSVSATLARTIPHDPNNTTFVPSITSPDPPPLSTHAPPPFFTDALPLDNQISVPVSTQVIGQTTTEGRRIPTNSLSPVTSCAMDIGIGHSSTSGPPKSNVSASRPADIAVEHTALSRAPSNDLNVRSSPSPMPVFDAILPTGLLSFQAATRSDFTPESHTSILATAAEGQGSTKASMSMEEDTSHSNLGIREEITAAADMPPQLRSPSPPTDVVIDSPSMHSLCTEHIEHRALDHTHSPYDIV